MRNFFLSCGQRIEKQECFDYDSLEEDGLFDLDSDEEDQLLDVSSTLASVEINHQCREKKVYCLEVTL